MELERLRGVVQGQVMTDCIRAIFPKCKAGWKSSTLCLACSGLKLSISEAYKNSPPYISSSNLCRVWVYLVWGRDSITFLSHTGISDLQHYFLEESEFSACLQCSLHQKSCLKMYWFVSELSIFSCLWPFWERSQYSDLELAIYTRLA